nr:importin subunit beta-3-like [Nicotiana tomentosiformis]
MIAAITFIQFQCVSNSNQKEWFQELLPALLKRLIDTLSNSDKEIAEDESLKEATRHLATEFLLTLVETRKRAPEQLCTYLDALEWEKRHVTIFALAYIAKGCLKVMIKNLEQVVDMVLNYFEDPHPRVRWAACREISLLLFDFYPDLQEQYHNLIYPALTAAMGDFHPQVQASSTRALCFFYVPSKPKTSISYLDGIVSKLLVLLKNDKPIVQQQALATLASISHSVKEHFGTYYDTVMSHLKTVLRDIDLKSNLIL